MEKSPTAHPSEITADALGHGTDVRIETVPSHEDLYAAFADDLANLLAKYQRDGRELAAVFPVGPVDYGAVAAYLNRQRVDCSRLRVFVMDEYVDSAGTLIPVSDRFSLRGYIERSFVDALDSELRPATPTVCPDPENPGAYASAIGEAGGLDAVFTGFGINGHWAFNEPSDRGEQISVEAYRDLPTRVVELSCETRTQLALGQTNGDFSSVPRRAITIGMRELLGAREIHGYFARSWHSGVVRHALHGRIEPSYPASLVRLHPHVIFRMSVRVAETPPFIATQSLG